MRPSKVYLPLEWFILSRVVLTDHWISNGHVSVRRELVLNAYNFESQEAVNEWDVDIDDEPTVFLYRRNEQQTYKEIFAVLADPDKVREFGVCEERVAFKEDQYKNKVCASFVGNDGAMNAYFQRRYIDGLYIPAHSKLYGVSNVTAFFDAPKQEDVTIIIMPVKAPQ